MSQKLLNKDSFVTIYLILKTLKVHENVTKTHLMYRIFTSNHGIKTYIKKVMDLGLIRSEPKGEYFIYKTTEKGEQVYTKMCSMIELLPHTFAKDFDQP